MYPLFIYFIKSFLSLGIFYFTWLFFFRKQTDFRFNRYYLILSTLLAVFIPLIQLPELFPANFQNSIGQLSVVQISEVIIRNTENPTVVGTGLSLATILWDIYLIGVIVMTIRFLLSLFHLYRLAGKSKTRRVSGIKYVFISEDLPVFSFFNHIFIRKEIFENPHVTAIINHEKTHVRQKHSLDLLILELLSIFQWFNPFIYLIKKAVKENHEFIADSGITVSESIANGYMNLLFQQASGVKFSPLTHNFSYSLLKKRLIMMKNQKSQKRMPVKLLLSMLALTVALFACNVTKQSSSSEAHKEVTVTKVKKANNSNETPAEQKAIPAREDTRKDFKVPDKMPEFPGGRKNLMNYLDTHIKYPEEARKAKIQGRVFVNFVIEKDGSISHIKILRGIGHGCDKEAVRVIKNMPRWAPGEYKGEHISVNISLPLKFVQ